MKQSRRQRHAAVVLSYAALSAILLASAVTAASGQENVSQGEAIASAWCKECHVVDGSAGSDAGPPLDRLAAGGEISAENLHTWLAAPHPPMPDFNLSRSQIDALVAYLRELNE